MKSLGTIGIAINSKEELKEKKKLKILKEKVILACKHNQY